MIPHDYMTLHTAKMVEYLVAVGYLLLFIPFWRFVSGPAEPAVEREHAAARPLRARDWFRAPDGLFYHPGHAWLRVEGPDTVAVGFDDFAGKLVGVPSAIALPEIGANLVQGEPAWALVADGKSIDMLSPVDGTVVEVNEAARRSPLVAHRQPYSEGWLLKVRSATLASNLKQLLTGRLARRWIDDLAGGLQGDLAPALGDMYADGGGIIDGLARALEPDSWDEMVRRFFLTDGHAAGIERQMGSLGGNHA